MTMENTTHETPPDIGDRVALVHMTDPYTDLRPGAVGTVAHIDDAGTVHVAWDKGATLGLVPGFDRWRPLHPRWDTQHFIEVCTRCGDPLVPGCCPRPDVLDDAVRAQEADR